MPNIDHLDASVTDSLNEIIQKATAKNPLHRYADALEFAAALRPHIVPGQTYTPESIVEQLTRREQEILQLIIDGLSNQEIADRLYIAIGTVKWYNRQIYKKLHVRNRVQAIHRARELDFVFGGVEEDEDSTSYHTYVTLPEPENPYKGLQAFQVADARHFFGRDKIIQKLVNHLDGKEKLDRFLTVVGPSGSGKSSLVKAGLIPALLRGDIPGSDRWFIADMIPGARPLDELEIALTRVANSGDVNLHEQLTRDENGLLRLASLLLPDDDSELVIVIDQFEEVFTLVPDEMRRTQFLDLIRAAVTDPRSRVRVVVTLRADFYDRPLHYPEFGELVRNCMETVLPLSAHELEQAIVKPAEHVGVTYEDGLVPRMIDEVLYQPGALPLLQYALTELFERRNGRKLTYDAYQTIGGTIGALAKRADELYEEQDEAGKALVHQLFLRLVTLGEGTEDTRRRATQAELLSLTDAPDQMDEIIAQFADYRLLLLDHDPNNREPTVEVAHEAILREWDRLRGWLNDARDDIKMQRQLGEAAQRWQAGNRDEGHLLRGGPLQDFERWRASTRLSLTPLEGEFLHTSLADRERRQQLERERQEREVALTLRARRILQGLVTVFLLAAVISGGLAVEANSQRDNAFRAQEDALRSAEISQSLALASAANVALKDGDVASASAFAYYANQIPDPPAFARSVLYDVSNTSPGVIDRFYVEQIKGFDGEKVSISYSALSDDGKTLLMVNLDTAKPQIIHLDLQSGDQNEVNLPLEALCKLGGFFWPGNEYLITIHSYDCIDFFLSEWDVHTGDLIRQLDLPGTGEIVRPRDERVSPEEAVAFWGWPATVPGTDLIGIGGYRRVGGMNEDGNFLMVSQLVVDYNTWEKVAEYDATDILWGFSQNDLEQGRPVQWTYTTKKVGNNTDRKMLAFDLLTGETVHEFALTDGIVEQQVTTSPDGNYVFTLVDENSHINYQYVDGESLELIFELESPSFSGLINNVGGTFSEDGSLFVTGTGYGQFAIWDMRDGSLLHSFAQQGGYVGAIFSDDNRKLITLSWGKFVTVWSLDNSPLIDINYSNAPLVADGSTVNQDRKRWVTRQSTFSATTGGVVNRLSRFDWQDGAYVMATDVSFDTSGLNIINTIAITPDGKLLAAIDDKASVVVWDCDTSTRLRQFTQVVESSGTIGILYAGDNRTLLIFYNTGYLGPYSNAANIAALDTITGDILWDLSNRELDLRYGALHRVDERYYLIRMSNDQSGYAGKLDITNGEIVRTYGEGDPGYNDVDISRDGKILVMTSIDGLIRFYDMETGLEIEERRLAFDAARGKGVEFLGEQSEYLFLVGFGADNATIATVIDSETNEVLRSLEFPLEFQTGSWFSPHPVDRYRVVVYSSDTQNVFDLDLKLDHDALLQWFKDNRFIRDLTFLECLQYQVAQFCQE